MILSMLLILTVSFVLLCFMMKRIVVHPVIAKLLGVCLIEISVLLYVVKFSNYSFITNIETFIYMKLAALELSVPQISVIMNWGVALLLASGALLVQMYMKNKYLLVLFLPILIFLAVNDPTMCERFYIVIYTGKVDLSIDTAIKLQKLINIAFVTVYAVTPYIMYIVKYFRTRLYYKKRNYVFSMLVIFLVDLLFYSNIMFSSQKNYFLFNLDLLKYPMSMERLTGNGLTLFYTAFVAVSVFLAIIILRPMGNYASGLKETVIAGKMNRTVSMLLHSYKNAFVAIEMFADDKNGEFLGSEEKRLHRIRDIAFEHEEKIKEIINVINAQNNLSLIKDNVSLNTMIKDAMDEMWKDSSVEIVFEPLQDYIIEADEYHLRESILCLLNNANEALAEKEDGKKITINTGNDENDVYIEVSDNGCGMENTRNVFNPLYSSKMGVKNFGIGLTYVKEIIEAHNGSVDIKSKVNEGTIVQLALKNAIKLNNKGSYLNE